MKKVFICSPYSGDIDANVAYARRAMLDSINRNEAPYVSHLLYTCVLSDSNPGHRQYGTDAAIAYLDLIQHLVVYEDRGTSPGMVREINHAVGKGYPVEYRKLL